MGAAGGGIPRWLKLDYIGRRNTWFAISGIVVVIAVGAIAIKGLNLGIDFRGGTQIAFETPQPVSLDQVRAQAAEIGQANAQIQGRGPSTGDSYRSSRCAPSRSRRTRCSPCSRASRARSRARPSG